MNKKTECHEAFGFSRFHAAVAAENSLGLDNRDDLAVLDELDLAVLEREEREVAALADVLAGVDLRTALADDDGASLEGLTVISLDAKILRVGIATVAG